MKKRRIKDPYIIATAVYAKQYNEPSKEDRPTAIFKFQTHAKEYCKTHSYNNGYFYFKSLNRKELSDLIKKF